MELRSVKSFAPGHISGYFKRVDGPTVSETGSLGAGIVIDRGVTVTMEKSPSTVVFIQGNEDDGWLVKEVLASLGVTAKVSVDAAMPIGAGFGMSAAGLLALYHAANRLFSLGLSSHEISEKSHEFEVIHETGLGDVAAASQYGIVVRDKPGIDGIKNIITSDESIYVVSFGVIHTPEVISSKEKMQKVHDAFPSGYPSSLSELMINSRSFAEKSGLLSEKIQKILEECDAAGVLASMTMLGDGVFAIGESASRVLGKYGKVYELHVAKSGPYIIE